MNRLRNRLIAAFLAATVLPLAATIWITTSLLDRSLGYATTGELDRLSRTLEATVRQFYQRERDALKQDALAGRAAPTSYAVADTANWPDAVRAFWDSGEVERFGVSGSRRRPRGLHAAPRRQRQCAAASTSTAATSRGIRMDQLSAELRQTRQLVESIESRDLRRGFTLTLLLLLGGDVDRRPRAADLHRPSHQPADPAAHRRAHRFRGGRLVAAARTTGSRVPIGRLGAFARRSRPRRRRVQPDGRSAAAEPRAARPPHPDGELAIARAQDRARAQELADAHPPDRRGDAGPAPPADRAFMDQAVQIVVSEIESLERRVRAFSEFSSEPPVDREVLDVNALVTERVALLRPVASGDDLPSQAR